MARDRTSEKTSSYELNKILHDLKQEAKRTNQFQNQGHAEPEK